MGYGERFCLGIYRRVWGFDRVGFWGFYKVGFWGVMLTNKRRDREWTLVIF